MLDNFVPAVYNNSANKLMETVMAKLEFTDANFATEVIKSEKPVLVDFWAAWCGPCRIQGPLVEQLSNEVGDKYKVGAMDVDANMATAQGYNILSIPTIMIFKGGRVVWQGVGVQQKERMLEELQKAETVS